MEKKGRIKSVIKYLAVFIIGIYLAAVVYFWERFEPNVWINGIYCTGKTAEEINQELLAETELPDTFTVIGYDSENYVESSQEFSLADIAYSADYLEELQKSMVSQIPWRWPGSLCTCQSYELSSDYSYDMEKLLECLENMTVYTQKNIPENYSIQYEGGGTGYSLYDGVINRLDTEAALKLIEEALETGREKVNLIEGGCYYDMPLTDKQKMTKRLWEKLEHFQADSPSYDFQEERFSLNPDDMVSFLQTGTDSLPLLNDEGNFLLDETAVTRFVEKLADQYDTYKKDWSFASTRGETIDVPGVTYGGIIDQEAEVLWLTEYLGRLIQGEKIAESDKIHIPAYHQEPYYRGKDSVGSTYIEVDMTEQKLYFYEEGRLTLETDVVTGSVKQRRETPEGVNFVYAKQQNRTLRGPGYTTFVKYWMPVNGNIGLHDASWRKEFGGEIYQTDGSHGCVNLPLEKADELYQEVEIGTPVVMFY